MFCFIFFHVFSQSQKWQIQVGFEIHDWLRYSSSILKSLAIWGLKKKSKFQSCQRILFWGIIRGLVWLWQIAKTPSIHFFFVLCFSHHTSHHQKITKTEIRTAKFAMKILSKIHTFFFVIHTFAKAIIIFLCVLNLAEWIEKKLRFFRAGITALVAKAFWQWISKIHYFKGFVDDNRGGKDKAKNQGRDNFFFM